MKKKDTNTVPNKNVEKMMKNISVRKELPEHVYILHLILYVVGNVVVNSVANSSKVFFFAQKPLPISSFAGVFSSIGNLCIISLVILFRKKGFITSLILLLLQFPLILMSILKSQTLASVSGMFTNVLTLIAIIAIYLNNVKIEKYQQKVREQAVTDMLTGLPNRFACTEFVSDLVAKKSRFAVVSVDLNNFKSINDTMGHDTGNKVLSEIAERWKNASETGISGTADLIFRQGGDEFAIVIQGYKNEADIIRSIRFYETVLEKRLTVDDCDFFLSASFGFAEYPADADNVDMLFTYADAAMCECKSISNGEHILHFSPEFLKTERSIEIEHKIRAALENNTIFYYLQPQYDISHKLRGFEALARLRDSEGAQISPGEFIPVAEKVGLIDKVDLTVFRDSAQFISKLIGETGADITLSVNVSVRHLMKNGFIDEIKDIINKTGIPAQQLEIEITESIMIDSAEKAIRCINDIKEIGIKIAIDDFGTGYSSLSYLNKFPADLLKIDKSFIDKMNTSDSSKKYVAAIISIGHIMNFDVISEGVEEPEQLETLRSIGCDYIQGYIWGRPMPPEEAEKIVMEAFGK